MKETTIVISGPPKVSNKYHKMLKLDYAFFRPWLKICDFKDGNHLYNPTQSNPTQSNLFVHFSVLLTRGSDCGKEDACGLRADDVARKHNATDCAALIEIHRGQRAANIFNLVQNVST